MEILYTPRTPELLDRPFQNRRCLAPLALSAERLRQIRLGRRQVRIVSRTQCPPDLARLQEQPLRFRMIAACRCFQATSVEVEPRLLLSWRNPQRHHNKSETHPF